MTSTLPRPEPNDQAERLRALDPARSILVQAPAGSGKTTLLTERFLRLLTTVDDPARIVAITFTNAAAAEMRNRILTELAKEIQAFSLRPHSVTPQPSAGIFSISPLSSASPPSTPSAAKSPCSSRSFPASAAP